MASITTAHETYEAYVLGSEVLEDETLTHIPM